jgi:outer membrane protein insertion porin family
LRKSRERVKRTGYFKEVDFAPSPTEKKEFIDVDIRVDEAEMGKLEFGAGYSTLSGVVGSVGLSHGNLFGRGYKAYLRAEVGEEVMNFTGGFTDPRFLDTPLSLGFDVYNETFEYDYYKTYITGGDIKLGREITDTIRADLAYVLERVRIYDVESPPYVAGDYIYDQQGTSTTGKAVFTVTRNTVDDRYFPTRGSEIWITGAIAGLGGDNYFYSAKAGASWFHPLVGDLVLHLRATAGMIRAYNNNNRGEGVPLPERLYVGGIKTLRGFEYGMAGPVDMKTDESLGALNMVSFQTELLYPLSKAIGLRGAVFYDVGKGWGGAQPGDDTADSFLPLRHAVGVGIRWYSPFGPISIDWGYNLNPISHRGEKSNAWDFSMGALF